MDVIIAKAIEPYLGRFGQPHAKWPGAGPWSIDLIYFQSTLRPIYNQSIVQHECSVHIKKALGKYLGLSLRFFFWDLFNCKLDKTYIHQEFINFNA